MKIAIVRDVKTPNRGTKKSAGIDFYVPNDFPGNHFLASTQDVRIKSGIYAKVPKGFALIVMNKSGQATKKGLQVGACVIDEDYQNEIEIHVRNISSDIVEIEPGEKLVQMLLVPVSYQGISIVSEINKLFPETSERNGGFGSTGTK
jgi:dUTP pyrophosphatase